MDNGGLMIATPHHVGLVVSDLDAAMQSYSERFGYNFFEFEVTQQNATLSGSSGSFSLRIGIGQAAVNLIELIQPVSGTTLYSRYLAERGSGLHHLAFSVTDLATARKRLADCGYPCLQDGSIHGLVDFSYYEAPEMACIVEPLVLSYDLLGFLAQNARAYVSKPDDPSR